MAQSTLNFAAQVDAWAAKTQKRMEAIFREATQRTVSIAQSNVPVDTGFLRASVRASLESLPPIEAGAHGVKGSAYVPDTGEITATIAHATLGETIFVGYTAAYAGFVEYGTSRMPPRPFVGLAVAQWPATVSQAVADAKSAAAGT